MPISDHEFFRYLPVSQRDQDWGLFVTGVGASRVPQRSSYPVSVHPNSYHFSWETGRVLPEHQVLYILRGEGEFESRTAGMRRITPGSVVLLFPGEWHRYRPDWEVGWEEYWFSYSGRQATELVLKQFIAAAEPVLHVGADDAILHPFLQAMDRVRAEPVGYQQLIAVNVMEVLAAAISAVRSLRTSRRAEDVVREARTVLEQHAEKPVNMEQLAASFSMSGKHFRRVFKARTGLSPYQYHLQVKIHRAMEMLRGTNLAIKQISAALHFENQFHFSNAFKQKTGMSPSRWRGGGIHRMSVTRESSR
jgi:AraC-like DNA-binding protein